MSPLRKTALVAGALYLITFATSIPARILFAPVRNHPTTAGMTTANTRPTYQDAGV
jgi:hypothetical protein